MFNKEDEAHWKTILRPYFLSYSGGKGINIKHYLNSTAKYS